MFLTKEQLDKIKKQGWKTLDTKDGTAWFGGKSHKELAKYISSNNSGKRAHFFMVTAATPPAPMMRTRDIVSS